MRPMHGVVVADGVVRCENGLTATAVLPPNVGKHDSVWVFYDFTTGCVSKVVSQSEAQTEEEASCGLLVDEPETFECTEDEDDYEEEECCFDDSGALEPFSDDAGFWDSEF